MYKILSLDGGGAWSIIQLKALQKIAITNNRYGIDADDTLSFLGNFDLIIGNSGGCIALAAILEYGKFSLAIKNFSDPKLREQIFDININKPAWYSFIERGLRKNIKGPRYSAEKKKEGLKNILKNWNIPLTKIPKKAQWEKTQIVICSFDYNRERAVFFRSNNNSKANSHIITGKGSFKDITLVNAVHCSSNAPVQFFDKPAYAEFTDNTTGRFWDGAIGGYNNPSIAGITEALANGIEMHNIKLLSVGTGNLFLPLVNKDLKSPVNKYFFADYEKGEDLAKAIRMMGTSIVAEPPDSSSYMSYLLLACNIPGNLNRYIRMNPVIQPHLDENENWDYPEPYKSNEELQQEFNALIQLEMDAWESKDFDIISKFTDFWLNDLIPNQAIRTDSKLKPLVDISTGIPYGFNKFSSALEALDWINDTELQFQPINP